MTEELRQFFNEKARIWDQLMEPETRERLAEIIKELAIKPGSRVLDVGTGTGVLLPFLVETVGPTGSIVALDIAEEMLARARAKNGDRNIEYVLGDITSTPFQEGTFDEIICNNTFPHLRDKPGALREMARILRPGGRVVICHPKSREAVNELHRSIGGVVANDLLPEDGEMRKLLEENGFVQISITNSPERYLVTACKPC